MRMVTRFRHKGLKAFYENGSTRSIKQDQVKRLWAILARLEASSVPADMDFPGLRLHPLHGDLAGFYAVDVSGNWRLIFRFDEHGNAIDLDLLDYH